MPTRQLNLQGLVEERNRLLEVAFVIGLQINKSAFIHSIISRLDKRTMTRQQSDRIVIGMLARKLAVERDNQGQAQILIGRLAESLRGRNEALALRKARLRKEIEELEGTNCVEVIAKKLARLQITFEYLGTTRARRHDCPLPMDIWAVGEGAGV